jgi:hypothetical protein
MYTPHWEEIDPEDMPSLVTTINRELKERPFDATMTVGKRQSLSFYAEYDLLELTDTSTSSPVYTRRVLSGPDGMQILNWTNAPIYTTNEKAPINISEDNAAEYVKFFFNFVKGRHGRFVIVENTNEINWEGDVPAKGKEAVAKIIKPVSMVSAEDGKLNLLAYMVFKDSLFRANVHVERDGMVSLSDEALVIEGMPIVEDSVPDEG